MGNLCIITARGGSKRIPRKNIKDFLGKPIIAYSIQAALDSGLFEEVMVSTDDKEIAEIAVDYGAKVPFMRSEKNSDDFTGTYDVVWEVLQEYNNRGQRFDYMCCLYPTAPLVSIETLKRGLKILKNGDFITVFPVCEYSTPIQRALKINKGKVFMFYPEYQSIRSQDLEPAYYDVGQFYWFDVSKINADSKIYSDNSGIVVLEEDVVQDIDNIGDWKMAELKYKLNNGLS